MKTQHAIVLTGMINGMPAKTHQAGSVSLFTNDHVVGGMTVDTTNEQAPVLTTKQGKYLLKWNRAGFFEPVVPLADIKIHVMLKKTVGKLIYWA